MKDELRPKGTVEVTCCMPNCRWSFWVTPDHPLLPSGPFRCESCERGDHGPGEWSATYFGSTAELSKTLVRDFVEVYPRLYPDTVYRVTVEKLSVTDEQLALRKRTNEKAVGPS